MRLVALCKCGAVKVQLRGQFRETASAQINKWLEHTIKAGSVMACGCTQAQVQIHGDEAPKPAPMIMNNVVKRAANLGGGVEKS